jgi:hypothetical protein
MPLIAMVMPPAANSTAFIYTSLEQLAILSFVVRFENFLWNQIGPDVDPKFSKQIRKLLNPNELHYLHGGPLMAPSSRGL